MPNVRQHLDSSQHENIFKIYLKDCKVYIFPVLTQGKKMTDKEEFVLTISEAAKHMGISRQGIYVAIKSDRLKAFKHFGRWMIRFMDLMDYKKNKYSRDNSKDLDGNLLYDHSKNEYSVTQVSAMLGIPIQRLYYWIREKRLPVKRYRSTYIINIPNMTAFAKQFDLK